MVDDDRFARAFSCTCRSGLALRLVFSSPGNVALASLADVFPTRIRDAEQKARVTMLPQRETPRDRGARSLRAVSAKVDVGKRSGPRWIVVIP
jgi:hypothetical protein